MTRDPAPTSASTRNPLEWAEHDRLSPLRRDGLPARLAPFVAVAVAAFAVAPFTHPEHPALVVASAGLLLAMLALIVALPWKPGYEASSCAKVAPPRHPPSFRSSPCRSCGPRSTDTSG